MARKGMGKGTGKGYKNIMGCDKKIHSQSARGIKQPQRICPVLNKAIAIQSNSELRRLTEEDIDRKEEKPFKDYFRELRVDFEKLDTSDLQGVVMVKSKEIMKKFKIPNTKYDEVEDLLLNYANGELDINSTQRYLLDLIPISEARQVYK